MIESFHIINSNKSCCDGTHCIYADVKSKPRGTTLWKRIEKVYNLISISHKENFSLKKLVTHNVFQRVQVNCTRRFVIALIGIALPASL